MSRKRTHRKQRSGMHPLDAIAACQPFPAWRVTEIMTRVHSAFADLRAGTRDPIPFNRIATMLNVGLVRSESIGPEGVELFRAGQAALMEADRLCVKHGRYGFTGPGLETLRQAIALYEEILQASTPRQMDACQKEIQRRVQAGNYVRAEHDGHQEAA